MELYEWGWIKKIPRVLVVNATGANTFYQLVNGLFENTELKWNTGRVNTDLIDRFYQKQQERILYLRHKQQQSRSENLPI